MCRWSIIYTDHQKKFPHLEYLKKSNPDAQILLADISNSFDCSFAWKNSDLLIRNWLKENSDIVKYDNIALVEWDVLIKEALPKINISGLMCKHIKYPNIDSSWIHFNDIPKLKHLRKYAIGTPPFALLFMNRLCIETWIDEKFDYLYDDDIYSELRLPSLLNSNNIHISTYPMPNIFYYNKKQDTNSNGIYHPIKFQC